MPKEELHVLIRGAKYIYGFFSVNSIIMINREIKRIILGIIGSKKFKEKNH